MSWPRSIFPEIACCRHNAASKMLLPDTVHHHTGSERILRAGDPFSQRHTVTTCRKLAIAVGIDERWLRIARNHARKPCLNCVGGLAKIPAGQDVHGGQSGTYRWSGNV